MSHFTFKENVKKVHITDIFHMILFFVDHFLSSKNCEIQFHTEIAIHTIVYKTISNAIKFGSFLTVSAFKVTSLQK